MSPWLAVSIVLLLIVVGLTLMQRRAQIKPDGARRDAPSSPPPRPTPPGPPSSTGTDIRTDPVLGVIGFNGGIWMTEADLELAGSRVLVEIHGTIDGPTDADRAWIAAATQQQHELEARAKALVAAELERRGVETTDLDVYELAVGPDDDGVVSGFLWYSVLDFSGEIGVKSTDHWRTLTVEVVGG